MTTQLEQVRDQQQATWDRFADGWQRWDELVLPWLAPVGEALLDAAALRPDSHVLDIAAGTGEPGLTAAARCPQGKVVITDLSENMLAAARANAARRGVTNVELRQCDVGALPFDADSFDAVTARFGFMFFPDMLLAAREMARVARPGAVVAASVWGARDKNPWATAIMDVIGAHVDLPPPPPGAPGLFRCAKPGTMAGVLTDAGLGGVAEREVTGVLRFASGEQYFDFMNAVAAPVVGGMEKADAPTRARIREEVVARAGNPVEMPWTATVVVGTKPTRGA